MTSCAIGWTVAPVDGSRLNLLSFGDGEFVSSDHSSNQALSVGMDLGGIQKGRAFLILDNSLSFSEDSALKLRKDFEKNTGIKLVTANQLEELSKDNYRKLAAVFFINHEGETINFLFKFRQARTVERAVEYLTNILSPSAVEVLNCVMFRSNLAYKLWSSVANGVILNEMIKIEPVELANFGTVSLQQ